MSLKEQLQKRSQANTKTFALACDPEISVTIRRITVRERNQILARFDVKDANEAKQKGTSMSVAMVATALVPPIPESEVLEMDVEIIDEIAAAINEFHGWSKRGRAELTDQFRSTT